ncbi:hypothetical protein PB1_02515 [Bacillus methanolicus PB1]|uniref:Uncharacterized protein n=1 Tax=Bacillus methanolicus PB1 TaxID=997296 RepID=I3E5K5_BACMT|nr:hypothetical protein [Bacillus methanolicus]EIJ81776.1 hypothetical protein PB1_02515 [Bacillus methanolicus PB1]
MQIVDKPYKSFMFTLLIEKEGQQTREIHFEGNLENIFEEEQFLKELDELPKFAQSIFSMLEYAASSKVLSKAYFNIL